MLFNSYAFILLFLPLTAAGYFVISRSSHARYSMLWLALASLVFYAAWNPIYVLLMLGSIAFNLAVSRAIHSCQDTPRTARLLLVLGIMGDLTLLGYYKYADFFVANLNSVLGSELPLPHIVLPLGISFFTFTQIAFLVDTWRRRASRPGIVNYALFVSYFPHLLAGPILHHSEMMPQFEDPKNRKVNYDNIACGLFLFGMGLVKKVVLADSFAEVADGGFKQPGTWALVDAWLIALAYTLQLYFDFSGYTDMALGISRMFNIELPINFNSPYRATSIQDFWRRWHITLSRFMREYIYLPLGGNRAGGLATCRNLVLTFLVGGLWHGAGWTFVVWGALHGIAMVVQRIWQGFARPLPSWAGWLLTFVFVNLAWVFFRANSVSDAWALVQGMAGLRGLGAPLASPWEILLVVFGLAIVLRGPNSNTLVARYALTGRNAAVTALMLAVGFLSLSATSPFIYFNF